MNFMLAFHRIQEELHEEELAELRRKMNNDDNIPF